ncbi:hypothetical protein [Brevibacillus sp. NRS-1366]|uniref:hypothetical protein n=1 Tax=Brevibacillus sp. NRS-1366 TaxID=3233899 RepID=UPI003D1ABC33
MDDLMIEPGIGIGPIKLGMNKLQVEEYVQEYAQKYEIANKNPNDFWSVFKIEFDQDEKVHFIEISSFVNDDFRCFYRGIDIFNTKAERLVEQIDTISEYDRSKWDLGFSYSFPKLGLFLWRPTVLKETDLQQEWFQEMDPDIQEDEMRNLYFRTVAIASIN